MYIYIYVYIIYQTYLIWMCLGMGESVNPGDIKQRMVNSDLGNSWKSGVSTWASDHWGCSSSYKWLYIYNRSYSSYTPNYGEHPMVKKNRKKTCCIRSYPMMYPYMLEKNTAINQNTRPGKHTKNYGKPPCLMGISTISMAIFTSFLYVYQAG